MALKNETSDEKLIHKCKSGQEDAYATLIKRHYRHVFAFCLATLRNVHDAEDIAQDTMLKGYLKIKSLHNEAGFGYWIMQIAKNLCIDLLRRQKHVKAILADRAPQKHERSDQYYHLQKAIRQLPMELRVPLIMHYFDDSNAKEIAKKLNISHSGACRRIRQARKQLHKFLTKVSKNE